MKTIILIMILATQTMAGVISQIEYNNDKTQIRKYIAGDYFFGSSTATAKTAYGVRISSNGTVYCGLVNDRDVSADGAELDTALTDIYNLKISTGLLREDLTAHTGDTPIHYTQAEISISSSQVSGLEDVLVKEAIHASTANYALQAGTAAYSLNSGLLDGLASSAFIQTPATGDIDMNDYRILNSSNIPYSPHSQTLVTAEYVYQNTPSFRHIVIGTITAQTTSTTFVELGLRSSTAIEKEGTIIYNVEVVFSGAKDSVLFFEIRLSTSPDYSAETIIGAAADFSPSAGAKQSINLTGYKEITGGMIGETIYFRMMWRTSLGTLTNDNGYAEVPNRKAIITFYPNAPAAVYEED